MICFRPIGGTGQGTRVKVKVIAARTDADAVSEMDEAAATSEKRVVAWYTPIVPVAGLSLFFYVYYMAVDTFARDFRLMMGALRGEDVNTLRQVLYGFGSWQPAWGYFATILRMLTAPWSLGSVSEAVIGRLGPALGWTMVVAGVITGTAIWGSVVLTATLGLRTLQQYRRERTGA
jgi:hypothetical protein